MNEAILEGFGLFLQWQNVLAIATGVSVGVVVGAIPGLTATMAVALALPFTFTLDPITGVLLLVGIYKGGVMGGSITAILIRTPGTPAAACTALDGYPMARRGEAGKALKAALYSSCIADVISNVALIFLAGMLAAVALRFGPPEFVWLIAFSLTVVVSISGNSLTKGLISGCLGILVSTIGLDLVYGSQRLTFNQFDLMDGVAFIPLLIGLFALPEILNYYISHPPAAVKGAADATRFTWNEFKRCFKTICRGSVIGVVIGIIPGGGPTAAAFLSYGEARRTSKRGDNFGKGEVEGVCASEAGNNGVAGATMIPLLALGIPGDVVTAIILGAFMVHGLSPGPLLFQENLPFVYAIFCGILLSSAFLLLAGRFAIKHFARIADIPPRILFPIVLMFCAYGSFAVSNNLFDVLLMLLFGIVGLAMHKIAMPAAPFLLGFVLGPQFEDNLRRTFLLSEDPMIFLRSPICWFFIAVTVLSLYVGLRREREASRRAARESG